MIKVLTLKKFKDLKADVIRQPNFVFETTEERFLEIQKNLGDGFVVRVVVVEPNNEPGTEPVSNEIAEESVPTAGVTTENETTEEPVVLNGDFPQHLGGGTYLLSNGKKIKGKGEATEAEALLKGEE